MKKTKFSDEKIAYILRQAEAGTPPSKCAVSTESANRLSIAGRSDSPGFESLEEARWRLEQ